MSQADFSKNPVISFSVLRAKKRGQKRCTPKNPRFSRVFFFFRRFSRFFKNQKTMRIKRCKTHFGDVGGDLNLRLPFFRAFQCVFCGITHRIYGIYIVNFLCLPIIPSNKSIINLIKGKFWNYFRNLPFFVFRRWEIISYDYKKADVNCKHCLYYSRRRCKRDHCCCFEEKIKLDSDIANHNDRRLQDSYRYDMLMLKKKNEWEMRYISVCTLTS